MEKQTC